MDQKIRIRAVRNIELPALARLVEHRLPDLMGSRRRPKAEDIEKHLATLLPDGALILATCDNHLAGLTALDLDDARILACYLDPERARADTARELIEEIEHRALSFGVRTLRCEVKPKACAFLKRLGYRELDPESDPAAGESVALGKDLMEHVEPGLSHCLRLLDEIGIPMDYGVRHRLQIVTDAKELDLIGTDIFGRDQRLHPAAAEAWQEMQGAARQHNIELQLVSGFRSVAYQANLVRRKLDRGESLAQVLRVSAAPGFSEHHSGRAIDLTTPGVTALSPEFADSAAYRWLKSNAGLYGFHETFPKDNRHGLDWEPWHWCFRARPGQAAAISAGGEKG